MDLNRRRNSGECRIIFFYKMFKFILFIFVYAISFLLFQNNSQASNLENNCVIESEFNNELETIKSSGSLKNVFSHYWKYVRTKNRNVILNFSLNIMVAASYSPLHSNNYSVDDFLFILLMNSVDSADLSGELCDLTGNKIGQKPDASFLWWHGLLDEYVQQRKFNGIDECMNNRNYNFCYEQLVKQGVMINFDEFIKAIETENLWLIN